MAVRDRNLFAWQAYVITMSFVSVGLLLGMFFLWRSYSDLDKQFKEKSTQLSEQATQFQTSEARVDRLLSMVGHSEKTVDELNAEATRFATDEKLGPVEKEFAAQMGLFAPNVAASEKNLMKLPKYLLDTVRARNEDIDKAREREAQILAEKTATLQRETKARQDAETALKKAETDLASVRQQHAEAVAQLNEEKRATLNMYDTYKQDHEKQLNALKSKNQELSTSNDTLTETVQKKMDELNEFKDLDFASPQGYIVNTASRGEMVWINLGQDDGLRVGTAFTVIDESSIKTSQAKDKAHIVITRIVDGHPHLSQARVTDYEPTNPIVTGDKVFSPAWRPGRTPGFALLGEMDFNGDYKDDIAEVRTMILRDGGKIDAAMDSKGNSDASLPGMNPNTEYLVLGSDVGVVQPNNPASMTKQAAYEKFLAEARQNGIMQISLDKLMGYLNADPAQRVIPMGDRIQGKDFPAQRSARPPVSSGNVSEIFQSRRPINP